MALSKLATSIVSKCRNNRELLGIAGPKPRALNDLAMATKIKREEIPAVVAELLATEKTLTARWTKLFDTAFMAKYGRKPEFHESSRVSGVGDDKLPEDVKDKLREIMHLRSDLSTIARSVLPALAKKRNVFQVNSEATAAVAGLPTAVRTLLKSLEPFGTKLARSGKFTEDDHEKLIQTLEKIVKALAVKEVRERFGEAIPAFTSLISSLGSNASEVGNSTMETKWGTKLDNALARIREIESEEAAIRVAYRKVKNTGKILAVFPDSIARNGKFVKSFALIDGHASVEIAWVRGSTVPAKPEEYAKLRDAMGSKYAKQTVIPTTVLFQLLAGKTATAANEPKQSDIPKRWAKSTEALNLKPVDFIKTQVTVSPKGWWKLKEHAKIAGAGVSGQSNIGSIARQVERKTQGEVSQWQVMYSYLTEGGDPDHFDRIWGPFLAKLGIKH